VADGPVDLLGHSLGGRVALGATLARPDLIRSLILEDTSAWSFLSKDESVRTLISAFMEAFDPANGMPAPMALGSPEDLLQELTTTSQWRQHKDELFAGVDPFAMKALGTSLLVQGIESVRPQLPTILQPATVLAGSNDYPLVDQAPDLAAELAHGHVVVIEGAYHSPHLTHPVQWREAVDHHLERIS
jgi:pimeloyl-ACP methyl ester carboxylesterase